MAPGIYYNDVEKLEAGNFKRKEFAFENLCKELLEDSNEYNFLGHFVIEDGYPGIESKPIKDSEGKLHSFQCKFSKKDLPGQLIESFFGKKLTIEKLKNEKELNLKIRDKLDILHIFTIGSLEDESKIEIETKLKEYIDDKLEIKWWNKFTINEELKYHDDIVLRYFPIEETLKSIHKKDKNIAKKRSKEEVEDYIKKEEVEEQNNYGFEGNYTKGDLEMAGRLNNQYILTKYHYFNLASFKSFGKIEKYIVNDKFQSLEDKTKATRMSLFDLLDYFYKDLTHIPSTVEEKISLDNLIEGTDARKGILINRGVHDDCNFQFKKKDHILFKKKNKDGGDN